MSDLFGNHIFGFPTRRFICLKYQYASRRVCASAHAFQKWLVEACALIKTNMVILNVFSSSESFEVTVNGQLIFSKLKLYGFPKSEDVSFTTLRNLPM